VDGTWIARRTPTSVDRLIPTGAVELKGRHMLGNVVQGRPWNEAPMQMNHYDLNRLFVILHECGLARVTVEFMDDGGNIGAYLLLRRPATFD